MSTLHIKTEFQLLYVCVSLFIYVCMPTFHLDEEKQPKTSVAIALVLFKKQDKVSPEVA